MTELAITGGKPIRSRPWPDWPRADTGTKQALCQVLNSGRWAISGPFRGSECFERRFASAFAQFCGTEFCTPVTNGTAALIIGLLAVGVGHGDEVLVPGLTWVACASSVLRIGATPILVDVDPASYCMSLRDAKRMLTPRTKAILLVHLFGSVGDLDGFLKLSGDAGIPIIEDCSQAHGGRWRGKRLGSLGAIGCFSMQQSKLLTSGEGGAVVTSNPELYNRLEQLRCDGRRFSDRRHVGRLELVEVGEVVGHNFCMSEFHAAILLDRLRCLDSENRVRRANARLLDGLLKSTPGVLVGCDSQMTERVYYNYVVGLDPRFYAGSSTEAVCRALSKELGTEVNPVYRPLNVHPLYRPFAIPRGNRSESELAAQDNRRFDLPNSILARSTLLSFHHSVLLDRSSGMHDIRSAFEKIGKHRDKLAHLEQGGDNNAF